MKEKRCFNSATVWILFILALLVGLLIGYIIGINMDNATITGQAIADDDVGKITLPNMVQEGCLNEGISEEVCLKLTNRIKIKLDLI